MHEDESSYKASQQICQAPALAGLLIYVALHSSFDGVSNFWEKKLLPVTPSVGMICVNKKPGVGCWAEKSPWEWKPHDRAGWDTPHCQMQRILQ